MPSPRRRSRDRRSRSRSHSPHRRRPPRHSRSPQRRPLIRHSRSPRRSRTHSPLRHPIRRSRSGRRSFSPRQRSRSPRGRPQGRRSPSPRRKPQAKRSPSPRGRPQTRRSPSPRGRPQTRRSLSPRGRPQNRRSPSPIGRPQARRSPFIERGSPRQSSQGQKRDHKRRQSPHSSSDVRGHKSMSPVARDSSYQRERSHSSSPKKLPQIRHKTDYIHNITLLAPLRRQLLSDRFLTDDQKHQGDLVIEDNIVIAIQRGPHAVSVSPRDINREFDSSHVIITRQTDEGKNPIFDREEIKKFGFDSILDENVYEERRIISVVPTGSHKSSRRSKRSPEVIRKFKHGPEIKLDFRPDPRYEPLMKESKGGEHDRIKRVEKNPNDLRHSLSKRKHDDDDFGFDARKKIEAKRKSSDGKEGGRIFDRIGDRSRERRREGREGSRDRKVVKSAHDRDTRRPDGDRKDKSEQLPDFKNRPDKFQYEEWKEKPEMIPRNPSYFEHDNREGENRFRGRGRGRGNFRGRPFIRGNFRGRGGRGFERGFGFRPRERDHRPRERESTWKHDLYDKYKDEEEQEKPSSTTKN